MADIESSLRSLVLQDAPTAATFGNRFYWNHIPEVMTYPCIKAQTITDEARDTHSNSLVGMSLVQLDVYDDDKPNCNAAAALLKNWLHRYKGALGTSYNATIKVRNVPSTWDAEARLFRRILEVSILYFKNV